MDTRPTPLAASGLTRSFGRVRALDGFDMELPRGKVTALVGPNGAGKTTLLLILAGLLAPDGGSVRVEGSDPATDPYQVHRSVGWMPDFFGVYDDLTATEYLELFGAAYGMDAAASSRRARELVGMVDLGTFANAKVHTMSRGQKQRLGFARTLVHEPTVLLLDEPASGLDPRARIELREMVRTQAASGVTVLVSSHILSELQEMSDLVVFCEAGRNRGMHALDDLPNAGRGGIWKIASLDPAGLSAALVAEGAEAEELPDGSALVPLAGDAAAADLLERLVTKGLRVTAFAPQGSGLEDAFMSLGEASS